MSAAARAAREEGQRGLARFHVLNETFDDILVAQEVGALDGVPCVQFEVVPQLGSQHGGGPSLGTDRVSAH